MLLYFQGFLKFDHYRSYTNQYFYKTLENCIQTWPSLVLSLRTFSFLFSYTKHWGGKIFPSSTKLKPICTHLQNSTNGLHTIKGWKHVIYVCLLVRVYSHFMHSFENFHYTCRTKFKGTEMKNLEQINKRSESLVHLLCES